MAMIPAGRTIPWFTGKWPQAEETTGVMDHRVPDPAHEIPFLDLLDLLIGGHGTAVPPEDGRDQNLLLVLGKGEGEPQVI